MDDNPITDDEIAVAGTRWVSARPDGERTGEAYAFYGALVHEQAQQIAATFRAASSASSKGPGREQRGDREPTAPAG